MKYVGRFLHWYGYWSNMLWLNYHRGKEDARAKFLGWQ